MQDIRACLDTFMYGWLIVNNAHTCCVGLTLFAPPVAARCRMNGKKCPNALYNEIANFAICAHTLFAVATAATVEWWQPYNSLFALQPQRRRMGLRGATGGGHCMLLKHWERKAITWTI